jgi:peptidase E
LIRKTWFIEVIQLFYKQGKPLYGGSAWAIILWKEIHTSPDINVAKLDFTASLWLDYCKWYAIFCHYTEKDDPEIYNYIQSYDIPVIALPEWTGVYTLNTTYYLGGDREGYLLTSAWKQKYIPWEEILF